MRTRIGLLSLTLVLGCFQDPGPPILEGDDDVVGESTGGSESETRSDESSDSGEAEAESDGTHDATSTDDSTTDTDTSEDGGIEGVVEPCGAGESCPNGGSCNLLTVGWFVFNICLPQGCTTPESCPPLNPLFGLNSTCNSRNECVIQCENNEECGQNMVCSNGQCFFNVFWGPCVAQDDCPAGSFCVQDIDNNASACLPGCDNMVDCPMIELDLVEAATCMDSRCEISCVLSVNCPEPMQCVNSVCRYPGFSPNP
jgi:hypothetical protein